MSFDVRFQPEGIHVHVAQGAPLRQAITEAGIEVDYPCGGQGTCGKCRVQILQNAPEPTNADWQRFSEEEVKAGFRLACQVAVHASMLVEVPASSRLRQTAQILGSAGGLHEPAEASDPPVTKRYVQLTPPTLMDDTPDFERLAASAGPITVCTDQIRALPDLLRRQNWRGTVVVNEGHLIDFEPGNTETECYAVAIDVGTTTLAGVLIDLSTGREAASVSRMNPQTRYGDDVLSRIQRVREQPAGLADLNASIVVAVNEMIGQLTATARIDRKRIYEAVFAGNTTMQHLLVGISPAALGEIPFVPALRRSMICPAREMGIDIHPRGRIALFPVIGGFVGGDTVAGVLVTGMAEATVSTLLVDIGTNGELVIVNEGKLLAASTAAGPAFEGATIKHGMRAAAGAVEEVVLNETVHYRTIAGAKPVGICGSALIDITAELLRAGVLTPQGLLLSGDDLPADLPGALRERVIETDDGPEFVIVPHDQSGPGHPITVSHRDFRNLQLGTGAIRAGIAVLLSQANVQPEDLGQVYVAGAFGNYIRPRNAQRMGLLPNLVPLGRIAFVGNTSLAGARRLATSIRARDRAETLSSQIHHVELSRDPNFQMEYMTAMFFPEEEGQ